MSQMPCSELPKPTEIASIDSKCAEALIERATATFDDPEVLAAIKSTLEPAKDFLLRNSAQMDEAGNKKAKRPWFDNSKFDPTQTEWMRTELRKMSLRRLTASHGLMYILNALDPSEGGGRLPETARQYFDDATDLAALQVSEILVSQYLSPQQAVLSLNLEELKPCFGYAHGANADLVRNKWVVPMVCLGLWSAKVGRPFEVRAGPICREFYTKVFEPVVKAYDAVLTSSDPTCRP